MVESVIDQLYNEVHTSDEKLKLAEEELGFLLSNLKKQEEKLKQAKSSVYQATKLRNELKIKLQRAKNKASGYFSQKSLGLKRT